LPIAVLMARKTKRPARLSYEGKITWLTFVAVAPAVISALGLLWFGDHTPKVQWTLTILIVGCMAAFLLSTREHAVRPLQTLSNLLAALREGDYSIRARGAREDSALGEVLLEVNSLGETLRQQRLGAFEATALLRTIMSEIDVAIFTFDPERRLRLINRAGETLLARPMDKLLGKTAQELGLQVCFNADDDEPLTLSFPGGSGRWGIGRSTFREQGLPHDLLVLTDLSRTLREEERRAWQRLVRVLGHEMNNSLAPINELHRLARGFAEPFPASLHTADKTSAASKTRHRSCQARTACCRFGTQAQSSSPAGSESSDLCGRGAD
jgi:two-component system nitrogen regulation sensor histidine kinase NtrY